MDGSSEQFSEEQMNEMKQNFALFDKDGNGTISIGELAIMIRSSGGNPSEAQMKQIMADADDNGSGCIEFPEFVRLMEKYMEEEVKSIDILDAFTRFDKDKSGFISANELKYAMLNLGEKLTEKEAQDMLKEADSNGDGQINYQEFADMLR